MDINNELFIIFGIFGVIFISIIIIIIIIIIILKSPFHYPYYKYKFDVSGKRNVHIEDLLDNFLISGNFPIIQSHEKKIKTWKMQSKEKIEKSSLKKFREKQYRKSIDDRNAYQFLLLRKQTRYTQRNYVKHPYSVRVIDSIYRYDYHYIENRYNKLKEISFETTLRDYHNNNQRKLITKELRKQIMQRDNYTCQICGKHMPDEVGLHIDHIIPISKGGKSVISNLQVLCSKCNGKKSNKMND